MKYVLGILLIQTLFLLMRVSLAFCSDDNVEANYFVLDLFWLATACQEINCNGNDYK